MVDGREEAHPPNCRNCRRGRPVDRLPLNRPCMHIALRWLHHAHRSSVLPATIQAAYL